MKHLHPSNSEITVHEYPLYEGQIENVYDDCMDFIDEKSHLNFIIGHSLELRTGQRVKGYEKDGRFKIGNVYLLYRCNSKNAAIKMEDSLIKGRILDDNRRNIRTKESWGLKNDRTDSYIVYLCTE